MPSLRDAWEEHAEAFITWAREPGHDSYWRFHRDAFLPLVPAPGRRTLDLGCGEGRLSRDLKALGHRVVGIDASPTMLAAAREADPSIETRLADAAALPFADGAFDCVVAFMSLQDVDDFEEAIRESSRVLEPGGRLCLAIVHPINSAGRFESDEPASPLVIEGSYLEPSRYEEKVERDGFEMTFVSDHRPLQAYADALADAGLLIECLREPAMPESGMVSERSRRWQRIPLFLHARALKPG
jgi:SAM-dependent methyltransferase